MPYLGTHLEQSKRELVVWEGRDEQPEGGVHPFLQLSEQVLQGMSHFAGCYGNH